MAHQTDSQRPFLGYELADREIPEETASRIDREAESLLREREETVEELIENHRRPAPWPRAPSHRGGLGGGDLQLLMGFFAPVMDLPQWIVNFSPMEHIPGIPLEDFAVTPLVVLTMIALAVGAVGMVVFRNRDLAAT